MAVIKTIFWMLIATVIALAVFVWSGWYPIGADVPHTPIVKSMLGMLVDRSIETRSLRIPVPDIKDDARLVKGAGNYAAMCAQCHLSPGSAETELSRGLYPEPPNLSKEAPKTAEVFWVVKHGIKASGMPAWGKSMDDDSIWNVAAFVQQLPKLDQGKYKEMVAQSGGHSHGAAATGGTGAAGASSAAGGEAAPHTEAHPELHTEPHTEPSVDAAGSAGHSDAVTAAPAPATVPPPAETPASAGAEAAKSGKQHER